MSGKIPDSWKQAPLCEIGFITTGATPPTNMPIYYGGDLPFVKPPDLIAAPIITSSSTLTAEGSKVSRTVPSKSVLVGCIGTLGKVGITTRIVAFNQQINAITLLDAQLAKWVFYAVQTPEFQKKLNSGASATTISIINKSKFSLLSIPIAPLREQESIIEILDELFSDLDAGVAALERVRDKLKLYRASVLKAAVEGTLTAEWRAKNYQAEPASELLKRILVERRRCWEKNQLARFKAKGQEPLKDWKTKYKEPVVPDISNLPTLPEGWCWATVDQCALAIQYGTSAKTNANTSGIPVLRMGNLTSDGRLLLDDLKYLPKNHDEFPELLLKEGDLIFNRTNSAELVGKTGVYDGSPSPCSFASYLIRVRLVPGVLPGILMHTINSCFGRSWIKDVANQTVGQANVNGTKLAAFVFPLAPLTEQEVVIEAIEDQFSVIDHLEAELEAKLKTAQSLRQSILHQAFTGHLVPQDPKDEPVSELLKRIAEERAARAKEVAAAKRPSKDRKSTRSGHRMRAKQQQQGEK